MAIVTVVALCACLAFWATGVVGTPDENRLYEMLFADYNPVVRPVNNATDPVLVTIGAAIQMIVEMDERDQHITTSLWMRFYWEDTHMRWDPDDYGGTGSIIVPLENVWRPDIVLYNNADPEFRGMLETSPILTSGGIIYWNSPAIYRSSCKIDVSFFPFDEQRCPLKFGSWSYDAGGIDLRNWTSGGDTSSYIDNGEWTLVGMPNQRNELVYSCCPEPYPDITFTIIIRRRPHFYLFNLLIPCLLTSFITALNFLLPADSGEKIGLALTVLLALTVYLLIVAETIPPSDKTPLIGNYFIATIFVVSLSTVFTVFVLQLHYQIPGVKPVPLWLRKVAFVYLAPVLRVQLPSSRGKTVSPSYGRSVIGKRYTENSGGFWGSSKVEAVPASPELMREVSAISRNLNLMATRLDDQDAEVDVLNQWKYVALVFDRLFLVVYLILTISSTVVILGQQKPSPM